MRTIKDKKLFLLDMDGTIYIGDKLFYGCIEFLDYIKNMEGKYIFLTNNSSKSVDKYIDKLGKLGISTIKDDFYTSTQATIVYLKNNYANKKIYGFGTKSFKKELLDNGLNIVDTIEDNISCLVMGFDTELNFKKLEDACVLLNNNVDYIVTNPDLVCPTSYGYVPDCGSVSQMLYNATKRWPVVIGKPQPTMVDLAIEKAGFSKDDAILIGDRIYTDIKCGINAGISTALVLSGETTIQDLNSSEIKPEFVFNDIKEIYNSLKI